MGFIFYGEKISAICAKWFYRLLGLKTSDSDSCILAINVYLTYYAEENIDQYFILVSTLGAILEGKCERGVMILRDFSACTGGRYYREWEKACEDYELTFFDVNATLSGSWLDHCLCTETVHASIAQVDINDNFFGSDHFPLVVYINFLSLPRMSSWHCSKERIAWDFAEEDKTVQFYNLIEQKITSGVHKNASVCLSQYCDSAPHRCDLDYSWTHFAEIVRVNGRSVFGVSQNRVHATPGWNWHLKDLYIQARMFFF